MSLRHSSFIQNKGAQYSGCRNTRNCPATYSWPWQLPPTGGLQLHLEIKPARVLPNLQLVEHGEVDKHGEVDEERVMLQL